MDSDKTLSALFTEDALPTPAASTTLTVSATGQGSFTVDGSLYLAPLTFASGTSATVMATASSGWSFVRWEDNSTNSSRVLVMDSDKNLTALFAEESTSSPSVFTTLTINNTGLGSFTVNSSDYLAPLTFASGTSATIIATASSGWSFIRWEDDSTDPSRVLVMDTDRSLTALFTENVVVPPADSGENVTVVIPRRFPGNSIQSRVINLISMGNYQAAEDLKKEWPHLFSQTTGTSSIGNIVPFTKNLSLNSIHPEVKRLQQYLNTHGFMVAKTGPGSLGKETNKFGALTKKALVKFQEAYAEEILSPLGLKKGTGLFGPGTRNKLNQILTQQSKVSSIYFPKCNQP